MKNCPSSQFLLAGNKQPPRGQLGGIFCQSRQKSLMDSMSRAKRGSFQQAKEKEVCILWSHSSALCTNLLRTALLDSGVALVPRKLPLLYCAPLYFGFMTPHQMLAATSLFSFSHLKCLNHSGPQECPKIWGQVVIQGLLKDKVLPLYLAKSKGAISHPAPRLRRPFYHGSYRFLYLFVQQ